MIDSLTFERSDAIFDLCHTGGSRPSDSNTPDRFDHTFTDASRFAGVGDHHAKGGAE